MDQDRELGIVTADTRDIAPEDLLGGMDDSDCANY